jgi:AcrR family transcriptional regulator/DNA-binding MarR family transcriptional regulator
VSSRVGNTPAGGARGSSRALQVIGPGVVGGNGAGYESVADGDVLGRERVGEIQRARIIAAMVELVHECGVAPVTVAHVVGRSGVSRRTFYELFNDRDDCLLAAFEHAVERAAAAMRPAYEAAAVEDGSANGVWEEQIRAGLRALLEFFDEEPAIGGLCIVDALAADRPVLEGRARAVDVLVDAVHRGGAPLRGAAGRRSKRTEVPVGLSADVVVVGVGSGDGGGGMAAVPGRSARPARIVAEGAVGAVLAVIHARMIERSPKSLVGLLNQLMGMIVLPYRGPEAAERERKRSVVRPRRRPTAAGDPLRELDMRLTYRTVRVLLALAELGREGSNPSSRQVADAAGVSDQGQISKLLWRLEHLGLIDTAVRHHGRGEPNAWSLTPKGQEVTRALRSQTG